jgi:hypothetical protein
MSDVWARFVIRSIDGTASIRAAGQAEVRSRRRLSGRVSGHGMVHPRACRGILWPWENPIVSTGMKRLLYVRQFLADVVPATGLRLVVGGTVVALLLAWLF